MAATDIKDRYDELTRKLTETSARLRRLEDLRNRSDVELKMIQDEEARLRDQAQTQFGTADPDELEKQAEALLAKSETDLDRFAAEIDGRYAALAEMGINL